MFPDNDAARQWFESRIWRDGRRCSRCSYDQTVVSKHTAMPYYCAGCKKRFSVKTGTMMEASNINYQKWVIVTYQFTTNLKGASSMKIHQDFKITQKSTWFMVHRLRESWKTLAGVYTMKDSV